MTDGPHSGLPLADLASETEIESHSVVADAFRPLHQYRSRYRNLHDGWNGPETRDLLRGSRVAAIVTHDPAQGRMVLIRQYRLSAHLRTGRGWLVEIPAGGIEEGEDAEAGARRELLEETGLTPLSIRHAADFMPTTGLTDEFAHLFVAEVDASALRDRGGHDDGEDIAPFTAPYADVEAALDAGAFVNGFTMLGLYWFFRTMRGTGRLG